MSSAYLNPLLRNGRNSLTIKQASTRFRTENSPLKSMLSATWKFEITKRWICLPSGWRKAHTCGIRYRLVPPAEG